MARAERKPSGVTARLVPAAIGALVVGVALMIVFEATVTRILGVLLILAFVVLGVFAIATPEYLGEEAADPPGEAS